MNRARASTLLATSSLVTAIAFVVVSRPPNSAVAQTASASASAPPSPSASASAASAGPKTSAPVSVFPMMASYDWPASESDEPADEDWARATKLRTVKSVGHRPRDFSSVTVSCEERALREWMRIECTPDHSGSTDNLFGVVWALGGDMSSAKATMVPASTLEQYKKVPPVFLQPQVAMTRLMGASAAITFRIKRGKAQLFDLDTISWLDQYEGGPVLGVRPGLIVDVSWALGEAGPSVLYQ